MLQVVEKWEAVTEVDVQTPLEVYQELKGEGASLSCWQCRSAGQAHCKQLAAELLGERAVCAVATAERKGLDSQLDSKGAASMEAAQAGTDAATPLLINALRLQAPVNISVLHSTMLQRQGTMWTT